MKTQERLLEAVDRLNQTTDELRAALPDAGWVCGDCITELIGRAATLKRDVQRLADVVRMDEEGGAK